MSVFVFLNVKQNLSNSLKIILRPTQIHLTLTKKKTFNLLKVHESVIKKKTNYENFMINNKTFRSR